MAPNKREIKGLFKLADEVVQVSEAYKFLSDEELRYKTTEFRSRLNMGETEEQMMVEAFAAVREASRRVKQMAHYPVQIIGGIVLSQGRIAEMNTGEGKTLVSTLPAYLYGLSGKGVHVVTVNDYLAKRDAELMAPVHEFMGLTVGVVLSGMTPEQRKKAYECDITYVTNSELGFDYLRDNMAKNYEDVVQRGLHYVIIDEVDSVLIDDARTPLVISGEGKRSTKIYEACDVLARRMKRGSDLVELTKMDVMAGMTQGNDGDFKISEKDKKVQLTEDGMTRVERFFRILNIADLENLSLMHHMELALRANYLMTKDVDYIVRDGEVLIVDRNTGRTMQGRRFSEGLHQAIEAKERVQIHRESRTISSITYQTFFNKYEKKGGMTGTGKTEESEFINIYGMSIVEIPTNRPVLRIDQDDVFFRTVREKNDALCDDIVYANSIGRPVLIGTTSVEDSESLSRHLSEHNIKHEVLNAKYHEREAAIVAKAGQMGAVTIATNMAGRGTDIKLPPEAKEAGGLLVIGTQRHDSRRVDGQLMGRSGRQGDPGESRFYLSIEDNLLRFYGGERLTKAFDRLKVPEGAGVKNAGLSKLVAQAQQELEQHGYTIRKQLIKYDEVVNIQRDVVFEQRREILFTGDVKNIVTRIINTSIKEAFERAQYEPRGKQGEFMAKQFSQVLNDWACKRCAELEGVPLLNFLLDEFMNKYDFIEESFGASDYMYDRMRLVMLDSIDERWMDHLEALDQLREGIGLVKYGKLDPVTEYKNNAFELFETMKRNVRYDTITALLHTTDEEDVKRAVRRSAGRGFRGSNA